MRMRVLNENVDFDGVWDDGTMRTNEMWLPSVALGGDIYTDNGYRIRENSVVNPTFGNIMGMAKKFYDISFFSSDVMKTSKTDLKITDMFLRLKNEQVTHSKNFFSLVNFLGAVGGVELLVM